MENKWNLPMTVEGLFQYCKSNNYMPITEEAKKMILLRGKLSPKFMLDAQDKNLNNLWKNCFRTTINEIQSDEKSLLCFMGVHKYKSANLNLGCYVYMLTNRRFIMTGIVSNLSDVYNPLAFWKSLRTIKSEYKCNVQSLYLNELVDVTVDMVKGHDVLKLHMKEDSFNIAMFNRNSSHKLCKEIHEILEELKKQQGIENANK